ncbi:tRNA (adenosine(37)-N6)-threonylcarbamoyltransferase complex dimerization subunit type 1 TsaB [Oxalobacteraceae bacterium OM1]|nr:tRNA (adenosine(37)-N6)-threonylcarbamoyltransferase complex dimerization subunit type 1 TsaB [Oxalobacteraceae bacterium OM1]
MPIILAVETSTELASAALLRGDAVIAREAAGVQTHSQTLLPMVQALLAEAGLTLAQCDAIAFGAGPGSFTGVRTACGIAQGLAFGLDLPVVPVSTLMAMAEACRERHGAADVLTILDARMEEVYWAQYRFAGAWNLVSAPALSAPAGLRPEGTPIVCGNGLAAYPDAFAALGLQTQPGIMPHAAQVARLGAVAFTAGQAIPARDAQPVYLRNKVAFTTAERLAKAAA